MSSIIIDPTVPQDSETASMGPSRIRNIATWLLQMFGQSGAAPFTFNNNPFFVDLNGNVTALRTLTLSDDPDIPLGAATKRYVDGGVVRTGVTTGFDNTYSVTLSPVPASLAELINKPFMIIITVANSGPATLDVNGLGSQAIVHPGLTPVAAGDLPAGAELMLSYDGNMHFIIVGPSTVSPSVAAATFAGIAGVGGVFVAAAGESANQVVNFQQFLGGSNWFRLPAGIMVQWLAGVNPGEDTNFPVAFPFGAQAVVATPTGGSGSSNAWEVTILSESQFSISSGLAGNPTFFVIAIGR